MQKNPHQLIEGMIIAAYAVGREPRFIYIRGEYVAAGRHPRRRDRRGLRRRLPRRATSSARASTCELVAAPRRRRLHLRRGDRPARLARGQARQPAPEAAVPGQPGPLPGPDADQQRRDALDRPAHRRDGRARRTRRSACENSTGTKLVSVSRQRAAPRQLRDRARHDRARHHLRPGRRPARGPRGQALVPRRLVLAGADEGRPRPPLRLRHAGQGRLDARLRRDHRRRRHQLGRRRRAEARRSSTATSPAASARRAARARTGP